MFYCPSCNIECVPNAKFCHNCGTKLLSNKEKEVSKRISGDSGKIETNISSSLQRLMPKAYLDKLLKTKGKIEGERRIVTILFSDIKGSTALSENLDPEDVLEIMNGAFDVLIEPITRYGGTLARLMGDAILAFFGAPIAHENDPYLACRAALDIIEGIKLYSKKLERERGIEGFAGRVGINTGLVVVAEVGADLRVEYTAMGDAVNTAARMESSAEPNTILITEATKKLIQNHFEHQPIGLISVKGKSEPISAYRLLGLKNLKKSNIFTDLSTSHLIGRHKELSELQDALRLLLNEKGKIISIVGEQGVGKSRLIEELRSSSSTDIKWGGATAYSYTQNDSYGIVRDVLKDVFEIFTDPSSDDISDKLKKIITNIMNEEFTEVYPFICHLLNIQLENDFKINIDWGDAETLKGQIHYAYKKFIINTAKNQPIVLVFEDLHWTDSASLELIEELFPIVEQWPIILILVYRSKQGAIWEMQENYLKTSNDYYYSLSLEGFDKSESIKFLNNLLNKNNISEKFQNQIFERTNGNPFFIEELVKSLNDRGLISSQDQELNFDLISKEIQIPNLLHSSILSRVDCLSQKEKYTLQIASVIGKKINRKLFEEIIYKEMEIGNVDNEIYELKNKGFIVQSSIEKQDTDINQSNEFIFKSSLIQEVVYDTLLLTQRKRLHMIIGEEIERLYENKKEENAQILAHHYEKGKVFDKAINYYLVSALKSKEIFANDSAIYFYEAALKLAEQTKIEENTLTQIYEAMGDVYTLIAEYKMAIDFYKKIFSLDTESFSPSIINYKCGLAYERWGRYDEAHECYIANLNQPTEKIGDKHTALSYAGIGMVYYRKENFIKATELNKRALEILEKYNEEIELSEIYNNLGIIYCKLEDLEKSFEYHNKCYSLKSKIGNISGLAASNNNLGYLYQQKGMIDKALEYYTESLKICEKTGNYHGLARVYDNISHVYLLKNKNDLAQEYNIKAIVNLGKIALKGNEVRHDIWLQSGVW